MGGTYRDLKVWQSSMQLAEDCYSASSGFPSDERFGLTSQLRRSAVSVPANIAEGYGRDSDGSFVQFLRVAQGSLKELETHVLLAQRLGFLGAEWSARLLNQSDMTGRMLRGLITSTKERAPR